MSRTTRPGPPVTTAMPSPQPSSRPPRPPRSPRPRRRPSARWITGLAGLYWSAGAVLLTVCLVLTVGLQRDATSARRAYGETRAVWVTRHDLPAGSELTEDDLELRPLPRLVVPPSAVDAGDPAVSPFGRVTRDALVSGEILLGHRLAGHGTGGPATLLPAGTVGLSLESRSPVPGVGVGDRVALILLGSTVLGDDPSAPSASRYGAAPASAPLTVPATVVSAGSSSGGLVVAVAAAEVGAVADAIRRDGVVVALLPPGETGATAPGGVRRASGRQSSEGIDGMMRGRQRRGASK